MASENAWRVCFSLWISLGGSTDQDERVVGVLQNRAWAICHRMPDVAVLPNDLLEDIGNKDEEVGR